MQGGAVWVFKKNIMPSSLDFRCRVTQPQTHMITGWQMQDSAKLTAD